jgi:magnesium chelatase family protein
MAPPVPDLKDVRGHRVGRFGLEVAAAGGHHMSLLGPPGVGKTLLAERLPGVLPDLDVDEAIEATTIASLAGLLTQGSSLIRRPPFQAPHHSASPTALLGTIRSGQVLPGAVTLAHGGVLFLDEAPEFARPSLEGLRQPLESGSLAIARAGAVAAVPARIQLVLAANPCPCGLGVDRGEHCTCTPTAKRRYRARLSGPLLDRIDVRLNLTAPARGDRAGECSAVVAERVLLARQRASQRFADQSWSVNAHIPTGALHSDYVPEPAGCDLLEEQRTMSARGIDRVARMAWTLGDLRGADRPSRDDVSTALVLRGGADDHMA